MRSREELAAFVESLRVPAERRAVVLEELEDHVFSAMAETEAAGTGRKEALALAFASLGAMEDLRRGFEDVESAFTLSLGDAARLGLRMAAAQIGTVVGTVILVDGMSWVIYSLISVLNWRGMPFSHWTILNLADTYCVLGAYAILAACFVAATTVFFPRRLVARVAGRPAPFAASLLLLSATAPSLAMVSVLGLVSYAEPGLVLLGLWAVGAAVLAAAILAGQAVALSRRTVVR